MKVKIFDCEHEKDLEEEINLFLNSNIKIVQLFYQTSHFCNEKEQIFSFSCLILYEE